MTNELQSRKTDAVAPCSPEKRQQIEALGELLGELPQVYIRVEHTLHAGVYARTAYVPAGTMAVGVELAKDSVLICQGRCRVTSGGEVLEIDGYKVLSGLAGRKSVCATFSDCIFTTIITTDAKTVEEAEAEYTNEVERLQTRRTDYGRFLDGGGDCGRGGGDGGCVDVLGGPSEEGGA